MAELADCVVIVDEAHLYAPSNKGISFPDIARWKMSMARKFGLDIYWLTQHERRVNSVVKDLTNMIFVCSSWADGILFIAKCYEPEHIRRPKKHMQRVFYRLNRTVAGLYDTLEIIDSDGDHVKDERIGAIAAARNQVMAQRRGVAPAAPTSPAVAEAERIIARGDADVERMAARGAPPRIIREARRSQDHLRREVADPGPLVDHEGPRVGTVVRRNRRAELEAELPDDDDDLIPVRREKAERCAHERAAHGRAGTCREGCRA